MTGSPCRRYIRACSPGGFAEAAHREPKVSRQ